MLVFDNPVLCDCHILIIFLVIGYFLFLCSKLCDFAVYILIFDLYHIFLILINDTEQFPLDLDEVVRGVSFAEVEHLFLENKVWIVGGLPVRMSISSTFFFFMVEFQ